MQSSTWKRSPADAPPARPRQPLCAARSRASRRGEQALAAPLQTEQKSIQTAIDALNGKEPDAALQARVKAFETKHQQAAQEIGRQQQQIQRNQAYVQQQIQTKLGPIYQQVMQKRGANVMVEVGSTLATSTTLDVTNDVLAASMRPYRRSRRPRRARTRSSSRRAANIVNDQPAGAAIGPLDIKRVMAALPHRYPMLLVDRVESLDPDKGIIAIKAVTINEPFFQGHFPGRPIMPGVLIVEALAQAAGVLAVEALGLAGSGKLVYFMAIEGAKFRAAGRAGRAAQARGRIRSEARHASASSPVVRASTASWLPRRTSRR